MNEIVDFRFIQDYILEVVFSDGIKKEIDLQPFIGKGFTSELLKPEKFKEVFIEPGGGLAWPNGFDICPNHLHDYSPQEQLTA